MGDGFDYTVGADGSKALAVSNQIEASLENVTKAAGATGAAMDKAFTTPAVKNSAGQYNASALAARQMKTNVADLCDQWARQDAIMERLIGPTREYDANLKALDSLFQDNAITVDKYVQQVTRLNAELDKSNGKKPPKPEEGGGLIEGSVLENLSKQGGELGGMFDSLISKGNLEAAALVGVGVEAISLGDEYLALTNKVGKYVTTEHSLNDVINDQLNLAGDLHSGMEQTLEVYDAVRDGTEDLNLSYADQIRLTKSIGEAVQLSGKSLDQAGGLMSKLSFAFSTGTISGRELKSIMMEFPDVAGVWTSSLGKTRTQLIAMADSGKLSAKQLMTSFVEAGDELDAKFGKRTETVGQAWQHFKDTLVTTVGKFIEATGIIKILSAVLGVLTTVLQLVADVAGKVGDAFGWVSDRVGDLVTGAQDFIENVVGIKSSMDLLGVKERTAEWDAYFKKFGAGITILGSYQAKWNAWFKSGGINLMVKDPSVGPYIQGLTDGLDNMGNFANIAAHQLGLMGDSWDSSLSRAARGMKLVLDSQAKIGDAKIEIKVVEDAWQRGLLPLDTYIAKMRELDGAIAGGKVPAFLEEDLKMKQAYGDLEDIKIAMDSGNMSANAYRSQYRALQTTLNGGVAPAIFKISDDIFEPLRLYKLDVQALHALWDSGVLTMKQYEREQKELWKRDPAMLQRTADYEEYSKKIQAVIDSERRMREGRALGIVEQPEPDVVQFSTGADLRQPDSIAPSQKRIDDANKQIAAEGAHVDAMIAAHDRAMAGSATTIDEYTTDLANLHVAFKEGGVNADEQAVALQALHDKYDDMRGATAAYAKDLKQATDLEKIGVYSTDELALKKAELADKYRAFKTPMEEYQAGLLKIAVAERDGLTSVDALEEAGRKLRLQYGQGTFGDGVMDGLAKIKSEVGDTGSIISKTMVQAFDQINTSLEEMVTTGQMNFDELGTAFEKMLVDMSLKLLESQLINFLAPGAGGGQGGGGGALDALTGLLGGAPKHATGTQYIIGGPSGTDKSLQAFWGTKGERVTVENASQQQRSAPSAGPTQVTLVNRNYVGDDEMIGSMGGRKGDRVTMNALRRNPSQTRAILAANRRR